MSLIRFAAELWAVAYIAGFIVTFALVVSAAKMMVHDYRKSEKANREAWERRQCRSKV